MSASLEELLAQQQELAQQIERVRNETKSQEIARIKAAMAQYGITIDDLAGGGGRTKAGGRAGGGKGSVPPKYRDPVTGATWTGRGKPPAWIAGKTDRTPYLI
jgi:DNA-binding protein H-NS